MILATKQVLPVSIIPCEKVDTIPFARKIRVDSIEFYDFDMERLLIKMEQLIEQLKVTF